MLAAPVNPSDLLFVEGDYRQGPSLPGGVGFEGVGIIEEANWCFSFGSLVGRRVAVIAQNGGTWGEYCVTSSLMALSIPDELDDNQAASYFINPASALMLVRYVMPVPVGNWLIQSAAASSLGRMVIRLGKHFRFRTINLVRNPDDVEPLKALGADEVLVVNERTPLTTFRETISRICSSSMPKFAIDPVGGPIGSLILNSLGEQGRMKVIASLSERPLSVSAKTILDNRLCISSFWLSHAIQALFPKKQLSFLRELKSLHRTGIFRVEDFQSFPLEQWPAAIQAARNAKGGSKVLLTMNRA